MASHSEHPLYQWIFPSSAAMQSNNTYFPVANDSTGLQSELLNESIVIDTGLPMPQADTFSTIVPALVQVFSVMAAGYLIGRMGILLPHEMKSINVFVARLALPALIFRAMCQLDFNDVNWLLLLAMFLAKITLFAVTSVLTILFSSNRVFVLSRAALYSIFVTQSNDLAFGYPVVQAVYSAQGYDFVKYLYLMAPITFLLLNPIGFIMLEVDKLRSSKIVQRQGSSVDDSVESKPPLLAADVDDGSLANLVRRQRSVYNAGGSSIMPVENTAADNIVEDECGASKQNHVESTKSNSNRTSQPQTNNNRRIAKSWAVKCGRLLVVCRLILSVLKNVFLNNIVLLTFAGIAANFIFQRNLPPVIAGVADVLANSFAAATLFSLGLRMVGQVSSFFGWQAMVPLLLIIAKTIFLPIIGRQFAVLILPSMASLSPADVEILSNFVFLYGTFPTAPTVFVFAQEFGREMDVIGTGLVACTFLSAPIMFVSSQMASLVNVSDAMLASIFQTAQFDVAVASAAILVWVILVLLLTHRARQIPHMFTLALATAQLVLAVLKIARTQLIGSQGLQPHSLSMCGMTAVMLSTTICTRLLIALLALVLLQLHRYAGDAWVKRYAVQFITAAIVVSLAVTAGVVSVSFLLNDNAAVLTMKEVAVNSSSYRMHSHPVIVQNYTNTYADIDPTFQFGRAQSVASAAVLLLCVAVISFSMARLQNIASLNNSRNARRKSLVALVHNNKSNKQQRRKKSMKRSSSTGPFDYGAVSSSPPVSSTDTALTGSPQHVSPIRQEDNTTAVEKLEMKKADEKRVQYRRARSDYPNPTVQRNNGYSIPLHDIREVDADKRESKPVDSQDLLLLLRSTEDSMVEEAAVGMNISTYAEHADTKAVAASDETQQLLTAGPRSPLAKTPPVSTTLRRAPASTGHLEDAIADFERRPKVCGAAAAVANESSFASEILELRLIERHMILHELQSWQVPRHALLILFNGVFMLIGFFFNTWRLLSPESQNTAIFFELQFLDTLLTMGQGFVTFAIFGLEPQIVLMPLYRHYRRWWHGGVETVRLPALHELNRRAIRSCRVFVRYHVGECKRVLHDKHYVLSKYENVISGHDMVEFLLESGLATSRQEAVQFGRDLLSGRIIEHVAREYHFYDFDFFYRLSDEGIDLWQQKEPTF